MLVAILADTHLPLGARRLPAACLPWLDEAELILHAGDLKEAGVLHELEAHAPTLAVRGNVDSRELARALPETRLIPVAGAMLALVHDAGPADGRLARLRRRFPEADAIVFGHSHIPLHEQGHGPDGRLVQIFNPGSPTDRRGQPHHTMGLARLRDGRVAFEHVQLD